MKNVTGFLYIRGQKTAPFGLTIAHHPERKARGRVRMNNGRSVFRSRKLRALARGASLLFFVFFIVTRAVFCVEEFSSNAGESETYNVTRVQKIVHGHVFWVEEDRPIEKVAGLYRPMDMDSYVQLKFNKIQELVNDLANKTRDGMDDLERRIGNLSKKVDQLAKKQDAWLKSAQNITNISTITTP